MRTAENATPPAFTSPKLRLGAKARSAEWYPYYAGYPTEFVSDVLRYLNLPNGSHVIDPWAGSGTTGVVGIRRGLRVSGFDLNPALVVIARARALSGNVATSLEPLAIDLLAHAPAKAIGVAATDPLTSWFQPYTARYLRGIERAAAAVLISPTNERLLFKDPSFLAGVSALAAFFYVAIFRTVRHLLRHFRSSNPTWMKAPLEQDQRVGVTRAEVRKVFLSTVHALAAQIGRNPEVVKDGAACTEIADSRTLPLPNASADACVASPPYCTRIDYVIGALPELAILGCRDATDARSIRDAMLGTPTMCNTTPAVNSDWGTTCTQFLEYVRCHRSHASEGYYWRNYLQYFAGLYQSVQELDRVLNSAGQSVLVVQDSRYKGRRLDLGSIVIEMASSLGWAARLRHEYGCRTIASINSGAKQYGSDGLATESVIVLARARKKSVTSQWPIQ